MLFISCKEGKKSVEKIDFITEYKFNSEIESELKADTTDWKYQISSTEYATKGSYKNAIKDSDLDNVSPPEVYSEKQLDSIKLKYKTVSAKDYIIAQSKLNTVIIINEAHHVSSHRVFTKSLLQELYDNGYKNLGVEALGNGKEMDSLLSKRMYPIQKTGYYTKEPQFGNLIREALLIGYKLFPYETTNREGGKPREIAQAKNIQEMMEKYPDEKFLIHCGYAHVLEGSIPDWEKTMAGRLTEYTGINPLTINQTFYTEKSKKEYNSPLLNSLDIKNPSVLIDANNKPFRYNRGESWADIAIFHPETEYVNDRSNWLFSNGNKNIQIDIDDIAISFPVMIFAYKKGEAINTSVPVDIYEVANKNIKPHLALKKGAYEIVIVNKEKEARKFEIEVN